MSLQLWRRGEVNLGLGCRFSATGSPAQHPQADRAIRQPQHLLSHISPAGEAKPDAHTRLGPD